MLILSGSYFCSPLSHAAFRGNLSMVKILLVKGAKLEDAILCNPFEQVNFQIIKYLLKRGANPKATDEYGNTLLHKKCERGNLKNIKYLIQHYNADVSEKNWQGQTPLHLACNWNNLKIVKFLIEEQNADPAVTCYNGKSALHYAVKSNNPSILRYLIEDQKQDIEATDNEGRTALHIACQTDIFFEDRWKTQKYLIEDHAKIIEAKDKTGKTALYYCLEHFVEEEKYEFDNFRPIALILATKAKTLHTRKNRDTDQMFDWIKQSYDSDMKKSKKEDEALSCVIAGLKSFQKKLDKKDLMKYNPILYIVDYCNRVDIAEYMFNQDLCYIEKHFNANSKRKMLLKSYLRFSCKNDLLDLARFLFQEVENRQDLFQHLTFDGSFLKTACKNKNFDFFKYLLDDDKAKDEAAEFLKDFPLHYACQHGSLEMVQYLIETKQIDIEVIYKGRITPLYDACYAGSIEIAKYLIEKQNANINTIDTKGRSVWHFACKSNSLELVKYISQKTKQDANAQDEDGSTALHLACESWWNLKVVKFLISDMKANLHLVDKEGRTPLHVAWQLNFPQLSISKLLVNKGANVLAKDKSGVSPLQIAKSKLEDPGFYTEKIELITFLKAATKR
jgi:ankyrin repeat protein